LRTRIAPNDLRFILRADERLTAVAELESAIRLYPRNSPDPLFNDFPGIVDGMFLYRKPSGNQKRFWRDPERPGTRIG